MIDVATDPSHHSKQLLHIRSRGFPNLRISENLPYKFAGGNPGFLRFRRKKLPLGFGKPQLKPTIFTIGLHAFEGLSITSVSIPNSVKKIKACAFRNTELQKVSIPSSVQEIDTNAFSDCQKLTEVFLPGTPIVIANKAFASTNLSVIHNAESYSLYAFERSKWWSDNKARIWASQGRCPYCGCTNFRGLIFKTCSSCGR